MAGHVIAQASTAGVYVDTDAVYSDDESAALYDLLSPWDPVHSPGDAFYDELIEGADSVPDLDCGTGAMLHWSREHGHTGRFVGLDPDRAALALARRRTDIEWVGGTAADCTVPRIDRTSLRFLDAVTLDRFLAESGFEIDARYGDWHRGPVTPTSREIITIARRRPSGASGSGVCAQSRCPSDPSCEASSGSRGVPGGTVGPCPLSRAGTRADPLLSGQCSAQRSVLSGRIRIRTVRATEQRSRCRSR
ncbi:hypothetical protein [Streptomyces sp. NPDC053813]|uniref:hypothetical protein n=1 Tax=Streptomyces sp. NPDC053813 TaxID=3365717 RepID=UPI0037D21D17